mmetsp:Transcript_169076/g.543369  ORF Transcript_169076/g.543369 Transcript_169076/m.543369 type:complete len:237 (-) Transcript_169076:37-747(-)
MPQHAPHALEPIAADAAVSVEELARGLGVQLQRRPQQMHGLLGQVHQLFKEVHELRARQRLEADLREGRRQSMLHLDAVGADCGEVCLDPRPDLDGCIREQGLQVLERGRSRAERALQPVADEQRCRLQKQPKCRARRRHLLGRGCRRSKQGLQLRVVFCGLQGGQEVDQSIGAQGCRRGQQASKVGREQQGRHLDVLGLQVAAGRVAQHKQPRPDPGASDSEVASPGACGLAVHQ